MKESIFIKIMNLIENETNMPMLEKDLNNWLQKSDENEIIYEIYKMSSMARDL